MKKYSLLLVKPAQMVGSRIRKQYKSYFPNITLPTLAAYIPSGFDIEIIDESIEDINFSKHYSIIAITALQNNVDRAIWLAKHFKTKWGDKTLVIGGGISLSYIVTERHALTENYQGDILRYFDHIFIGESDYTWENFLKDFLKGVKREKIIYSEVRPDLKNMPFPRLDLIKWNLYSKLPLFKGNFLQLGYLVPIETSRGCPYDCTYCCVTKFWGKHVRYRPVSDVIKHIKRIPEKSFIVFTDDNIASIPRLAKELFRQMIKEKVKQRFFAQFTFRSAEDTELLQLASEAGCKNAYLGMESISPDTLISVNKVANLPEEVKELVNKKDLYGAKETLKLYCSRIFSKFKSFGIHPFPSIIIGLSGDSVKNVYETAQFLIDEGIVAMTQWFYTPLIGSEQFSVFDGKNSLRYKRLGRYDGGYLSVDTEKILGFLNKDIEYAFWDSYQKFYSVPNIFKRIFKNKMPLNERVSLIILNLLYYRAVMQHIQPFMLSRRTKWIAAK